MKKTDNYKLAQYEPSDPVTHRTINEDNYKLDQVIKRIDGVAQHASDKADKSYGADTPPMVAGVYQGDDQQKRTIQLGFRPKAVFVAQFGTGMGISSHSVSGHTNTIVYGGLALDGHNLSNDGSIGVKSWVDGYTGCMITADGFQVGAHDKVSGSTTYSTELNKKSASYYYMAFR